MSLKPGMATSLHEGNDKCTVMKWFCFLSLAMNSIACNNDNTDENGTAPIPTNVENVNGNIPDTTSGTILNTPMETDTIGRDSATNPTQR